MSYLDKVEYELFDTSRNINKFKLMYKQVGYHVVVPSCERHGNFRDSCRIRSWNSKTTKGSLLLFSLIFIQ